MSFVNSLSMDLASCLLGISPGCSLFKYSSKWMKSCVSKFVRLFVIHSLYIKNKSLKPKLFDLCFVLSNPLIIKFISSFVRGFLIDSRSSEYILSTSVFHNAKL